jgi:hypothetical protein
MVLNGVESRTEDSFAPSHGRQEDATNLSFEGDRSSSCSSRRPPPTGRHHQKGFRNTPASYDALNGNGIQLTTPFGCAARSTASACRSARSRAAGGSTDTVALLLGSEERQRDRPAPTGTQLHPFVERCSGLVARSSPVVIGFASCVRQAASVSVVARMRWRPAWTGRRARVRTRAHAGVDRSTYRLFTSTPTTSKRLLPKHAAIGAPSFPRMIEIRGRSRRVIVDGGRA